MALLFNLQSKWLNLPRFRDLNMIHLLAACTAHVVQIALITTILSVTKVESKQPEAPNGYSWQSLDEVRAKVLVPKNWHFSKMSNRDLLVYRVTKEKLGKDDVPFLTGITINVTREVPKKTKVDPSVYAVKYIKDYIENVEVVEEPKIDEAGGMQRITCQVVKKLPNIDKEKLFRVRVTTLANDKTGTLYILIFGTPRDEWDGSYKIGKPMFNPIVLDPAY